MIAKHLFLHSRQWLSPVDTYALRGLCMIMIVTSHVVDTSATDFYKLWGGWGTGVFFFLSGYGLFHSLSRRRPDGHWLRHKMRKLMEPYLLMWAVYLIFFIIFDRQRLTTHLLHEFLTLSMPGLAAWFFKVILGLYILDYLVFRLRVSNTMRLAIVTIACLLWYIVARRAGLGPWWFNTVLCFPFGMAVALWYPLFERRHKLFLLPMAVLTLAWAFTSWGFVPYLWFTATAIYLLRWLDITSPILQFIGTQSLFFYFLEVPANDFLLLTCPYHPVIYVILALIICYLITWGYLRAKRQLQ